MLSQDQIHTMIKKATLAYHNAFVPKSDHSFGACVLTTTQNFFEGCTVESFISGLGTCAERAAVDHAVIHGEYSFIALAVVGSTLTYPCGACLQYLTQFYQVAEKEIVVVVSDLTGKYSVHTLFELLPHAYFTSTQLDKIRAYNARK